MTKIYFPGEGLPGWKRLLADPEKHWRAGYSAMTLASCWEAASTMPHCLPEGIREILTDLGPDPKLLLALPEHKVPLDNLGRGDSQCDVFALIRAGDRTIALTVEGKVDESFDKPLGEWLVNASDGKRERLARICDLLGLHQPIPGNLYYQLLHRTAAAVLEARRFKTDAACMIVHSFSPTGKWFDAFESFVAQFGQKAERGLLIPLRLQSSPPLYAGWATGDPRFLLPHSDQGEQVARPGEQI